MPVVAAIIVTITLVVIATGRAPAVLALICALLVAGFLGIFTGRIVRRIQQRRCHHDRRDAGDREGLLHPARRVTFRAGCTG